MPNELIEFMSLPESFDKCPKCGVDPFTGYMRGLVKRRKRDWLGRKRRKVWAVICWSCKEIVGWEDPKDPKLLLRRAIGG